jgi:hypothetical protein
MNGGWHEHKPWTELRSRSWAHVAVSRNCKGGGKRHGPIAFNEIVLPNYGYLLEASCYCAIAWAPYHCKDHYTVEQT